MSSLPRALLALFGVLLGCLLGTCGALATDHDDGVVVKWQAPRTRPLAFGEFPTKSTQKVIHVGYPKTGTVSLAKVIDQFGLSYLHGNLGYKPADWSSESKVQMEDVLGGVDAWMEMLGRFELDKLLALYPKAKYILTTRDPDAWYRSATRFFKGKMTEEYFVKHFGSADFDDAETWKNHFLAHIEKVKQTIPAEQLLVIDLTAGNSTDNLQKLCRFVEVEVCPAGGMPHEHSTDDVLAKQAQRSERRLKNQELSNQESESVGELPEFGYVTMISSQSNTLEKDIENVKVWASSLDQTGTEFGVLCAVVGGHLSPDQEEELRQFASISYPEDSLTSPLTLPLGVEDTPESQLELAKMRLSNLQVKALMYMAPEHLVVENVDSALKEFSESGLAFQLMSGADAVLSAHGAFMLAPRRVRRVVNQVVKTRSWSPTRGWLSTGPVSLGGRNQSSWDFPGSAGGLGLFLSGCVAGSPAAFRRGGCSFTAPDPEALCTGQDESHYCRDRRSALSSSSVLSGDVFAPARLLTAPGAKRNQNFAWSEGRCIYTFSVWTVWSTTFSWGPSSTDAADSKCPGFDPNATSTSTTTTSTVSTSTSTSTATSTSTTTRTTTSTSTATTTTTSTSTITSTTTSTSTFTTTTTSTSTSTATTTTTSTSTATSTTASTTTSTTTSMTTSTSTATTTSTTTSTSTSTTTTEALYLTIGLTFNDLDIFESATLHTSPANAEVNDMLMAGFGVIDGWSAKRIESLNVQPVEGRRLAVQRMGTVTYWCEVSNLNCTLECVEEQLKADFLRTVNAFAANSTYLKDLRATNIVQIGDLERLISFTDSAPVGGLPIFAVLMVAVVVLAASLIA